MAYTRMKTAKDGKQFYEIVVSRGRGKSQLSKRWYVPDGWGQKAIERQLAAVAAEFERQCDSGEAISRAEKRDQEAQEAAAAAKVLTLTDYCERVFLPAKAVTLSENSRYSYKLCLESTILPALGSIKMPDITPAQISAFLLQQQSEGKAHGSVVKYYVILQGVFRMAYLSDSISKNPMDKVERPRPRKDEVKDVEPAAYTPQEVKQILAALDGEPLKWRALVRLLIDTGIRRGECCALRWDCIDFDTGAVEIRANLSYTAEKGVYLDTPKNSHFRTVYAGDSTIALLQELRAASADAPDSAFVFTQEDSTQPMHPQSPTRFLKRFSERHGIPDLHPHKLRHTFASVAITSGADVASVSEALGHSDKAVTLRMYTHANSETISRAAQVFRNAIETATAETKTPAQKPIQNQDRHQKTNTKRKRKETTNNDKGNRKAQ